MWKALICLGLVGGTAAAKPSAGTVDGWRGPFESIDAATAADGSPTEALATLELPSGAPIDELRTVRGTIVPDGRETLPWHLVASTHAGWFIQPGARRRSESQPMLGQPRRP